MGFGPGKEPGDLAAGMPNPDSWGMPYAKFVINEEACPTSRFKDMRIVINTDFCGAWGNFDTTFHAACPQVPASMTCRDYVTTQKEDMKEAYWSITKLDVYQQ